MTLRQSLAPLLTPAFRTLWRVRRGMTLGVRGVALDAQGRVMLVRHTYTPGWHLPGGGVERDETVEQAMRKEFAEEAGIEPTGALHLVGLYLNASFRGDHVALFRAEAWRPCPPDSEGEIAERAFFSVDALPPDTRPYVRRRLAEALDGAPIDGRW